MLRRRAERGPGKTPWKMKKIWLDAARPRDGSNEGRRAVFGCK
jgi:hypothetical protein